jgi:prepilin-type N-terminal cleavage/methylation domain-containing protein
MRAGRRRLQKSERGFTLIELMIAVTLVAAISTGMLLAMRTGLLTMDKVDTRLQENRRVVALQQMLVRQLSSVIPAVGQCGATRGAMFSGNAQVLRMVSSYSLADGARGYPQMVDLEVLPDPQGGLRLIENERFYFSPLSVAPFCGPQGFTPQSFEIAGRLAVCRISYREYIPEAPNGGNWLGGWNRPNLPAAMRIEMTPLQIDPSRLTLQTVNIPIRVNREVLGQYDDIQQ